MKQFSGKIINSHPSLLPKYGGRGMYGRHVHRAVIDNGDTETGVSIHLVTENYDEGPVLRQKIIPVSESETIESLENKVKTQEKDFLVETLSMILNGQLKANHSKHSAGK